MALSTESAGGHGEKRPSVHSTGSARLEEYKRVRSTWEIACITSFNFPFGALCGPMGIAILPLEAATMVPDDGSIALGLMMGVVGVSQLICPFAGKMSDCWQSRYGRRRPFIL